MRAVPLRRRSSGVLLHPTCLPGVHGSGDIGHPSRRFVDDIASAAQSWWQMLPVGPPGYGQSPYSAESSFAGHPLLISPEDLLARGLLGTDDLARTPALRTDRVDFVPMEAHRTALLRAAFGAFERRSDMREPFQAFCHAQAGWLDDFAVFRALKHEHRGVQWTLWEAGVRRRDPSALKAARVRLARDITFEKFVQFVFDQQWSALRAYAESRHVALMGDLPIFVAHDSADVWQNPDAFFLDSSGDPSYVAGVPPDYFSATGQRWGNPLYRWRRMARTGYAWWIERMRMMLRRFHAVRLDHFIGFHRYWRIPASEPTAVRGRWMKGPGANLFEAAYAALGDLPFLAEDLGVVTPGVRALRDRYRLPGLKILQFAFGTDAAAPSFLPHRYRRRSVVYTGTHDNDTVVGWFRGGVGDSTRTEAEAEAERSAALRYLGTNGAEIHWDMIRAAFASVARIAMVPLQDVLGLGSEARMNRPGRADGNWSFRFEQAALSADVLERLALLTRTYGRAPGGSP